MMHLIRSLLLGDSLDILSDCWKKLGDLVDHVDQLEDRLIEMDNHLNSLDARVSEWSTSTTKGISP